MTDKELERPLRGVIAWAAVAVVLSVTVAVLALIIATKVVSDAQTENSDLRQKVETNEKQAACRSRISSAAESLKNDRDTAQSRFVIAVQRQSDARAANDAGAAGEYRAQASAAVDEIERINELLQDATDLRAQAVDICAADPGFLPPVPKLGG